MSTPEDEVNNLMQQVSEGGRRQGGGLRVYSGGKKTGDPPVHITGPQPHMAGVWTGTAGRNTAPFHTYAHTFTPHNA